MRGCREHHRGRRPENSCRRCCHRSSHRSVALVFDYINGFHDAANSIATVVSTRVLTPRPAVAWAAFFNFIAFVIFPLHVAHTIGKGIIDPKIIDDAVLFSALGGAIAWNIITWVTGCHRARRTRLWGASSGLASARAASP